jgi:hypothetical protein
MNGPPNPQGNPVKTSFLLLISLCSLSAAVQAQSPPAPTPEQQAAREAVRKACASDVQTLCPDKKGHEAMMCLRSNPDKVSAGCKDAMAKMPRPAHPPAQ